MSQEDPQIPSAVFTRCLHGDLTRNTLSVSLSERALKYESCSSPMSFFLAMGSQVQHSPQRWHSIIFSVVHPSFLHAFDLIAGVHGLRMAYEQESSMTATRRTPQWSSGAALLPLLHLLLFPLWSSDPVLACF